MVVVSKASSGAKKGSGEGDKVGTNIDEKA
jgi:hypothetical protein